MRDTVNVLREGVPAVALVHEPFRRLAHMVAGQVGMADAPLLIYPRDLVSEETPAQLEAKAGEVAEMAVKLLLGIGRPSETSTVLPASTSLGEVPEVKESEVHGVEDLNAFVELAYEQGWTDGLPVYPPTDERVCAMLDYLGRNPADIVGVMPPGEGIATIEKIAINAVMAGCKPEYMPILVTAVEALLDPRFELLRVQATTAGPAPLAIISGPVVKQLGFNYGAGAFTGTGHRPNATIGRAIRLILWNIGYGRPGQMSQATMGHPARYAYLVAERPTDDGNQWEPFNVTQGLSAEDNAVSVFPSVTHYQITPAIGTQTFDNSVFVIVDSIVHLANFRAATQKMLVLNPQAVQILHAAGWTKAAFRDVILQRAVRPVRDIKRTGGLSVTYKNHWTKLVDPNDDDALVPSMIGPDGLQILVTGGWGSASSQSVWIDSVHGELITRKINWSWD